MGFLSPLFLVGLLGIAVPVIIHLWSRNATVIIPFGTVRFLENTQTKTIRTIKPSQWVLLMLRCLIISVLTMIISGLILRSVPEQLGRIYLIDTSYHDHPFVLSLRDSLKADEQMLWLASGFPEFGEEIKHNQHSFWTLLSNPNFGEAREVWVVSPLLLEDFWGRHHAFPIEYQWLNLPFDPSIQQGRSFISKGSYYLLRGSMDSNNYNVDWQKASEAKPIEISYYIHTEPSFADHSKLISAAIETINAIGPVQLNSTNKESADFIFWLSESTLPRTFNTFYIDPDQVAPWHEIRKGLVSFSPHWSSELAVQQKLPQKLLMVFAQMIDVGLKPNLAINETSFKLQPKESQKSERMKSTSLENLLWMSLILLFILERFVSFKSVSQ